MEEFCYLGDMLSAGGGAGEAARTRVKCAWKKFRELSPILTAKGATGNEGKDLQFVREKCNDIWK